MEVVLLILKIIGIVLLALLGLIILLLLIVLFVPVRYRAKGDYEDSEAGCDAVISFLLHIIALKITYKKELKMVLKIFGIPLFKLYPKKPGKDKKPENAEKDKDAEGKSDPKDKDKEKNDGNADGSNGKSDIKERLADVLNILNDPTTVRAWEVCKKRLGRLIKHILPSKIKIDVTYGLDDPFISSEILAVYNAFYTYLGEGLTLMPVYEGKYLEVHGRVRGYVMLASVLWHTIMVIFDKDCRKFYKHIKNMKKQS